MTQHKKLQIQIIEAKKDNVSIINKATRPLLYDLREYASKRGNIPGFEVISRLIEQLERGQIEDDTLPLESLLNAIESFERGSITIRDLLITFLAQMERFEAKVRQYELHQEVKRRRDLPTRFEVESEKAASRRDAIIFLELKHDMELLAQAPTPTSTRQIDPETVDLAARALRLKAKYPKWNYARIATELFNDPSEADRIKKAVQRTRKAMIL